MLWELAIRFSRLEFLEYLPLHFPHSARSSPPPLWRSSLWSKPSCKSMCAVSRTASVLHNQHFKAAGSIIRPLSAFAHAFHFSGPCWVNTETVCSWHHLSLRGFLELCDLLRRDFFNQPPPPTPPPLLEAYLPEPAYNPEDFSLFICKASSPWLVKLVQSPWIITSIHF